MIPVDEWNPVPEEDVLIYAIDTLGLTYEIGHGYFAVDRWCVWLDGTPPSWRTDFFSFGKVTHVGPLPSIPQKKN